MMLSRATIAACRAAIIERWPIEPEQSMMMISPAAPSDPAAPASRTPIRTIALTSVPPSGRYSFW